MNTLWVIGWLGAQVAYLNITQEEAEERYCREEGVELDDIKDLIYRHQFYDRFPTYAISGEKVKASWL